MDSIDERLPRRSRRARLRRQPQWIDDLCLALLAVVVVGSALALGTVHRPVLFVIAALALFGGVLATRVLPAIPKPAFFLGALAVVSLLQATPLPARFVAHLSPASAQVWEHCLDTFKSTSPAYFPVSIDGSASLAEALKWLTYAAVCTMAARVRARRGASSVVALVFGCAVVVSVITLLHGAANATHLYGFYQPSFAAARWSVGPILNSNNFAGYAILGLFAGVGIFASGRPALPRFIVLGGVSSLAVALCVSTSRAGIVSTGVGASIIALWYAQGRSAPLWLRRTLPALGVLVIGAVLLAAYAAIGHWQTRGYADAERKVAVWRWSMPMIREHWALGVGRGAFETAFPPYRQILTKDWTAVFTHAENFAVQWLAEWGVPVGLLAVVLVCGAVGYNWFKARRDPLHFCALTGIAMLLLQNLADLGLEIPALVIAAVTLYSVREPGSSRSARRSDMGRSSPPRAWLVGGPALLVWLAAVLWAHPSVESERVELSAEYRRLTIGDPDQRAEFRRRLEAATRRHPGEAYFPLLGSLTAVRARDDNPLPWIGRALELNPTNGRVHLVLAELLHMQHASAQAMLHLRYAAQYDGTLRYQAAVSAGRWASSLGELLQAIPDGNAGDFVLATACGTLAEGAPQLECLEKARDRTPDDAQAHARLAEALFRAMAAAAPPCVEEGLPRCRDQAEQSSHAMERLDPGSWRARYIAARVLFARGEFARAAELLARTCPVGNEGRECLGRSVTAALASDSETLIANAASSYAARGCDDAKSCAASLDWLGGTLRAGGKRALAQTYLTKAAETEGSANRWLRVATYAAEDELFGVARIALDRADRSPDSTPDKKQAAAKLRGRLGVSGFSP